MNSPSLLFLGDDGNLSRLLFSRLSSEAINITQTYNPDDSYDYLVCCVNNSEKLLSQFAQIENKFKKKILILPFQKENNSKLETEIDRLSTLDTSHLKMLYYGNLFGENMDLSSNDLITTYFKTASFYAPIKVPVNDTDLYLSYLSKVLEKIVRYIFSYYDGKEIHLLATKTSVQSFCKKILESRTSLSTDQIEGIEKKYITQYREDLLAQPELSLEISDFKKTLVWLSTNLISEVGPKENSINQVNISDIVPENNTTKIENKVILPDVELKPVTSTKIYTKRTPLQLNKVIVAIGITIFTIISPYILLAISIVLLKLSTSFLSVNNYSESQVFAKLSEKVTNFGNNYSSYLISKNILPGFYSLEMETFYINSISVKMIDEYISIKNISDTILENVSNDNQIDIDSLSNNLFIQSSSLFENSQILLANINDKKTLASFMSPFSSKDYFTLTENIQRTREISQNLRKVLGYDKQVTIALTLLNNSVPRAGGGSPSVVSFITLKEGKIISAEIINVSAIDGNFKGRITPPENLSVYLDNNYWLLKDLNLDNNADVNGQKIAWFIKNELDRNVDLVLTLPKDNIFDYLKNNKIAFDENNLEDVLQIFTNTYFSTSNLSTKSMDALRDYIKSADLQYYSENDTWKTLLTNMKPGSGSLNCLLDRCYDGSVGFFENAFKDNSSGLQYTRSGSLVIKISDDKFDGTMDITLKQKGNSSSDYDFQGMFVIPKNSDVHYVQTEVGGYKEFAKTYTQVGNFDTNISFPVSVGNKGIKISISWTTKYDKLEDKSPFRIVWLRQPGMENYPVFLSFIPLEQTKIEAITEPVLTSESSILYNTNLSAPLETVLRVRK